MIRKVGKIHMVDILNFPLLEDDIEEDEDFLSEVPLSIIENSIENQFDDPLEYRKKDYINEFILKYDYMKQNENDYEDGTLDEFHDEFISFIKNIYDEKLDLGFPDLDDTGEDDQHELIHFVYKFFIRYIKKNFVTIICNEIDQNKSELADLFDKRKDITYNTFKEEIGDEEYASIISNMDDIIHSILNKITNEYDVDKFFEMCDYGEVSTDREYIINAFNDFKITGNFIEKYTNMVRHNEFVIVDIETKVRSHILKNFPIRRMETQDQTENDTEDESSEEK